MVTYTSNQTRVLSTTSIDARSARADRYRPALSFSPVPAARLVDLGVRATAPVGFAVKGDVCPFAVESRLMKSHMDWQHGTTSTIHNSIVFGGFGFDRLTDDITTRVGPPPPRRTSV